MAQCLSKTTGFMSPRDDYFFQCLWQKVKTTWKYAKGHCELFIWVTVLCQKSYFGEKSFGITVKIPNNTEAVAFFLVITWNKCIFEILLFSHLHFFFSFYFFLSFDSVYCYYHNFISLLPTKYIQKKWNQLFCIYFILLFPFFSYDFWEP